MSKYCFGVDVGGTTVKLGLFDLEGNVQDKWEIITRTEENGKNILPDVAKSVLDKMAEKNIAKDEVAGIGIGVPGPVNDKGVVLKAVNLGWDIMDVKEILGGLTGLAVQAGNDANVAALGEMWRGGGQGFENMVLVTLGTGVGGGVILGGKILTGATGAAGEIGHIHIEDKEGDACGCGNHGCLEQYASERALFAELSSLKNIPVNAEVFGTLYQQKDPDALRLMDRFIKYIAIGINNLLNTFNPDIIVLNSALNMYHPGLCDEIVNHLHNNMKKYCRLMPSTLQDTAVLLGGIWLIRSQFLYPNQL